jgi:hypothetical protein
MISITLLTISICLSSFGIINAINSLELTLKMRDMKNDIKEVQRKKEEQTTYSQRTRHIYF